MENAETYGEENLLTSAHTVHYKFRKYIQTEEASLRTSLLCCKYKQKQSTDGRILFRNVPAALSML